MRLCRRFEVRIEAPDPFEHSGEVDEDDMVAMPIARFAKRPEAKAYAMELRAFLRGRPR